ncbi:hypothetical protein C8R43DRAFT_942036 [Mycena crocata]|nr:hypothetical protein C8R43DRAFT_942036 [Mycena crocata]
MRLILPNIDPTSPAGVKAALISIYDALIHESVSGRIETLSGLGEFCGTIIAAVTSSFRPVFDDGRSNVIYRVLLACPDWSSFGWSNSEFMDIYGQQTVQLTKLAFNQRRQWPFREARFGWVENGHIVLFISSATEFSVPLLRGTQPPADALELFPFGATILIDATFHCGLNHNSQQMRADDNQNFSIEALRIQRVLPLMNLHDTVSHASVDPSVSFGIPKEEECEQDVKPKIEDCE